MTHHRATFGQSVYTLYALTVVLGLLNNIKYRTLNEHWKFLFLNFYQTCLYVVMDVWIPFPSHAPELIKKVYDKFPVQFLT